MMANYTMTIEEMMNDDLTKNIFSKNYKFYIDDEQCRKDFEEKFINHYYYREIGFESPFMFIHKLNERLNLKSDYWTKLYDTELKARDINFLLNKDLLETVTHTVSESGTSEQSGKNNSTATNTTSTTETGVSSGKESSIADGVAQSSLGDGYLTSVNAIDTDNESSTNSTQSITQTQNINGTNTKTITETNELVSKGNIGVTSSAQLLKEWREVLINMDEIIIKDLEDLFLKIY